MIFSEGEDEKEYNYGTICAYPEMRYVVTMEILRDDLADDSERVVDVKLNGESIGGCNPDGDDHDCNFFQCPGQWVIQASRDGSIYVVLQYQEHSYDCDCNTHTWECSAENTVAGRTPVTAAARFTLTPIGIKGMLFQIALII